MFLASPAKVVPQPIAHTSPRIQPEYPGERTNLIPIPGHRSSPNPVTMEARSDNRWNFSKNFSCDGWALAVNREWIRSGVQSCPWRTTVLSLALTPLNCTCTKVIKVFRKNLQDATFRSKIGHPWINSTKPKQSVINYQWIELCHEACHVNCLCSSAGRQCQCSFSTSYPHTPHPRILWPTPTPPLPARSPPSALTQVNTTYQNLCANI